jgi:hypothetical protein
MTNIMTAFPPGIVALVLLLGLAPSSGAAALFTLTARAAQAKAPSTGHLISVRDSPGYVPLHDPDSLAEALGRRPNAPRVQMEFHGGPRSLDELGRAVCHALHTGAPDSMLALCVKSDEFRVILWPEFPQSRPATGLHWDDAWMILWARLNGGSIQAVREFGDHYWELVRLEYAAVVPYKNFRLYNGITVTVKNDEGEVSRFTFIRSIAQRKGRFKIYSMRD